MNIYEKLQKARIKLQQSDMKKTGHNKFAGYYYFELADFIVPIQTLCDEFLMLGKISYGKEMANLTLIDIEKPEDMIVFESPMSEANLKGAHAIQNLGAVETYLRRYLWMTAFEIVEHDAIDSSAGADDKPVKKESSKPVAQVAWEAEDEESQKYLKGLADDVKGYLVALDIESAVFKLEDAKLSADEKVAIWFLFDSKQRRSIKDYQDNQRAKEQ